MRKINLDLQLACDNTHDLPTKANFLRWLHGILPLFGNRTEITVRIVTQEESRKLNFKYRGKNNPTNVLSFFFDAPPTIKLPLLGDLIICSQVIKDEAQYQKKSLEAHWAHIVIHGALHLLAYDHTSNTKAIQMELLETKIMKTLGYPDPFFSEKEEENTSIQLSESENN